MNLKNQFNYLDNSEEIKKKEFEKMLRRLDKPLFSLKEQEKIRVYPVPLAMLQGLNK